MRSNILIKNGAIAVAVFLLVGCSGKITVHGKNGNPPELKPKSEEAAKTDAGKTDAEKTNTEKTSDQASEADVADEGAKEKVDGQAESLYKYECVIAQSGAEKVEKTAEFSESAEKKEGTTTEPVSVELLKGMNLVLKDKTLQLMTVVDSKENILGEWKLGTKTISYSSENAEGKVDELTCALAQSKKDEAEEEAVVEEQKYSCSVNVQTEEAQAAEVLSKLNTASPIQSELKDDVLSLERVKDVQTLIYAGSDGSVIKVSASHEVERLMLSFGTGSVSCVKN